ncbi:type II CAAX endopeptidase family protein [Actinoplanes sp. NEAU-A12]|uniref:Type II CAAX endopeptidase family protein n=1 Tax=Actinoplanes sandaracinus TaxID=3045177 RepID=A0ABT6WXJ0_9ACTN|nr:type II CAAX endopeptidase family protein [Actinoplanes sandaracinus]MDI6104452.1 type II CAAX endopeptidase family protein [Actinoplanes sandaracinus]
MRTWMPTAAGLTVLAGAPILLLATGHTRIITSADEEAAAVPLAAVVVPCLVGLILIRLVPPSLPVMAIAGDDVTRRQARGLAGVALLFTALAIAVRALPGGSDLYPLVKVLVLLGGGWLVLRSARGRSPARAHRERVPRLWYRLGPVPAVLAWGYLYFYSPLAGGGEDVSGYADWDRVELALTMLFVFFTASVLEEWFYRVALQTRLEALWGRWPAITAAALLFVLMHAYRLVDEPSVVVALGTITSTGALALMAGYLWSRYRNMWAIFVVHGAANALALIPLFV